jgi:hypothetical protein
MAALYAIGDVVNLKRMPSYSYVITNVKKAFMVKGRNHKFFHFYRKPRTFEFSSWEYTLQSQDIYQKEELFVFEDSITTATSRRRQAPPFLVTPVYKGEQEELTKLCFDTVMPVFKGAKILTEMKHSF